MTQNKRFALTLLLTVTFLVTIRIAEHLSGKSLLQMIKTVREWRDR